MDRAVALHDAKRYREALAMAEEVARLDPSAVLPDVLLYEARRALLKRRARRAAVLVAVLVVAVGALFVYRQLARIRFEPAESHLELTEFHEQRFRFRSGLGAHRRLEFTWVLLLPNGRAAPPAEQSALKPGRNEPWACAYAPGYDAVSAAEGHQPLLRRVVAIGADTSGGTMVRAEWFVRVSDVPMPPKIVEATPRPDERIAVLPGGSRAFRVEALDGDGGADVTYEWLVGDRAEPVATTPTWTYRRDGEPERSGPRQAPTQDKETVACRVSNRHGKPFTQEVAWTVERVPSNERPKIVAIEPDLRDTIRFSDDRPIVFNISVHDPDKDEELHVRWLLDGAVIATTPRCRLSRPRDPAGTRKLHRLRLVVTDLCGATDERTWTVLSTQ
jgi:hypothetical protein